jgi:hypothetical protein
LKSSQESSRFKKRAGLSCPASESLPSAEVAAARSLETGSGSSLSKLTPKTPYGSEPAATAPRGDHEPHFASAPRLVPRDLLGDSRSFSRELELFYRLGVDGVFSDNPDTAVAVRSKDFR